MTKSHVRNDEIAPFAFRKRARRTKIVIIETEGVIRMLSAIVIDDEADLRLLARFMLEDAGAFEVIGEAGNATEALEMIGMLVPDIAIIDLHLPDMSGIELIQQLRDRAMTLRLVAYSSDDLGLADALLAGADRAVLKTGRSEELIAALVA